MKHIAAVVAGLSLAFVGTSNAWATEGACCIVTTSYGEDPTNACSQMTSADCELAGGVYLGGDCSDAVCRTITICASGCDHWHVQTAIDDSSDGDLLYAYAATHSDDLCSLSTNSKKITIAGKTDTDGTPLTTFKKGCADFESVFWFHYGETHQTVIQDLIITGGNPSKFGGGILCENSSPTITNCTIKDNTAGDGAGIYLGSSNPTITDCDISGNTVGCLTCTGANGGGIFCYDSNPTISNCTIQDNTAQYSGGGIYLGSSNPTITGCTISGNTAACGSGIYNLWSASHISDCTITGNTNTEFCGTIMGHMPLRGEGGPSIITLENSTLCGTGELIAGNILIRHSGHNHISDCIDDGDLDGDGDVDTDDLNALHDALGIMDTDVNNTGCINIDDLLLVIEDWGTGCP
jgi:parallel beta-helix repeat protein